MWDPRFSRWAEVLVHHSLQLEKGDLVKIAAGFAAEPLVAAVFEKVLEVGAHPYVRIGGFESLSDIFFEKASEEQLRYVSPLEYAELEHVRAYLNIWTPGNLRGESRRDPEKMRIAQQARRKLMETWMQKVDAGEIKACITLFPTVTQAQEARMSLRAFTEFVFDALHLNDPDPLAYWRDKARENQELIARLEKVKELRLEGDGTDLRVRVEGRRWINDDGRVNFPGGEVFTSPVETETEGEITFNMPSMFAGREVRGVRLVFREGRVVEAHAQENEAFLQAMLQMDDGASRLGEFAIGTNENIQEYTGNTLFDEKIGGTVHIALGHAFPQAGGTNASGLHWDMVFDLRQGGRLYADGTVIMEDGVLR